MIKWDDELFYKTVDYLYSHFSDFNKAIDYKRKSIFPSEALAFIAMCRLSSITSIIESGMAYGGSTEYFGGFGLNVLSVDLAGYGDGVFENTVSRLRKYKNILTVKEDSTAFIPELLSIQPQLTKTAVFIDGTKGESAFEFAKALFVFPCVQFIAIHDLPSKFEQYAFFNTKDPKYRTKVRELDVKTDLLLKYPDGPGILFFDKSIKD
ncbi:MAG: hypothetical protein ABFD50_08060 [Smithella sp.]